jgi:MoaA/NifB/PqqE/SkfB family radical SAM enzyme
LLALPVALGGAVMANIMAGSLGGLFPNLSMERLEVLSVVLNNSCNLRCRHCYLEPESHEPFLNREEWCTFFTSVFRDLVPSVVSFAGKEIFSDHSSVGLLFEAIQTRDRLQRGAARRTHIGVITNGTLLHRFRERILECPADHIDVSVDGLPPVHNEIRGPGAFDQLAPNLHWLTEAFPDRVWLTHTLFTQNVRGLPEFVTFYERMFGQRRFSLGLYQPLPYTSSRPSSD